MMAALLFYADFCAVRSSRLIEAGCRTDAAFRVICDGLAPRSPREPKGCDRARQAGRSRYPMRVNENRPRP
jgi:hypothetical protein